MADYWFTVASDEYGAEDYGPYDSELEALAGINRVKQAVKDLTGDSVKRLYSEPFQKEG